MIEHYSIEMTAVSNHCVSDEVFLSSPCTPFSERSYQSPSSVAADSNSSSEVDEENGPPSLDSERKRVRVGDQEEGGVDEHTLLPPKRPRYFIKLADEEEHSDAASDQSDEYDSFFERETGKKRTVVSLFTIKYGAF